MNYLDHFEKYVEDTGDLMEPEEFNTVVIVGVKDGKVFSVKCNDANAEIVVIDYDGDQIGEGISEEVFSWPEIQM